MLSTGLYKFTARRSHNRLYEGKIRVRRESTGDITAEYVAMVIKQLITHGTSSYFRVSERKKKFLKDNSFF